MMNRFIEDLRRPVLFQSRRHFTRPLQGKPMTGIEFEDAACLCIASELVGKEDRAALIR